jgi:hypothetical protein
VFRVAIVGGLCHTCITSKGLGNKKNNYVGWLANRNEEAMNIGDTFTTQKSGVSGTVQEIIKNANGSTRVRLSVNGADRWTTVK